MLGKRDYDDTNRGLEALEKHPPESRETLKMVIKAGSWVRYNQIFKKFGGEEDNSYFWESELPASTIRIEDSLVKRGNTG